MIEKSIQEFLLQFQFHPKIHNSQYLKTYSHFCLLGMGGSALAAEILLAYDIFLPLTIHRNYGLPVFFHDKKKTLFIASSYSGNTEEVLDGVFEARKKKLAIAIITKGGKLLEFAKSEKIPFVQLPDTGIQPRMASGLSLLALMKCMRYARGLADVKKLSLEWEMKKCKELGKRISESLFGKVPIIYSSERNKAIAHNWKIRLNETGKIPAFFNVFPELNHNEMTGYDRVFQTHSLSEIFSFVFLLDEEDHSQIKKRMKATKTLLEKRGLPCQNFAIEGKNRWKKIFQSIVIADWIAFSLASRYGVESEHVPMVEEFKKHIH